MKEGTFTHDFSLTAITNKCAIYQQMKQNDTVLNSSNSCPFCFKSDWNVKGEEKTKKFKTLNLFAEIGNENLIFDEGAKGDPHLTGSNHGRIVISLQQRKVCCNLSNPLIISKCSTLESHDGKLLRLLPWVNVKQECIIWHGWIFYC